MPSGLPTFGVPDVATWDQFTVLLATAVAIFIVILAQSAATSRAYAAKYEEQFDENVDLVGLALANVAAGLHRHVRGQRQPDQDPDGRRRGRPEPGRHAHHRRDRAPRAAVLHQAAAVHADAVLASVVFLIGIELVDVAGMRKLFRARRDEFAWPRSPPSSWSSSASSRPSCSRSSCRSSTTSAAATTRTTP